MTTSFVTVVRPPKDDLTLLACAVGILARATRATFSALYQKRCPQADVKRTVCGAFGILARHWSGCRAASRAAVKSWRNGGRDRVRMLETRLEILSERWPKDCLDPKKKRRNAVARRKAETAIARLEKELKGSPRWCFGGRKLLRQGRLGEWRRRRDSQAFFCGETGSKAGNQVAQWRFDNKGETDPAGKGRPTGLLALRLPDVCDRKHLVLRDVCFPPAKQSLLQAAVKAAEPVTWRVKLLPRGKVQLCVTLEEPEPPVVSDSACGVVAVDLNRDHLAVTDVSPCGRVVGAVRLVLRAGSDAVSQVAKAVVDRARKSGRPVVLENLDLRRDKAWLRSYGKRFARILSVFRSRQVRDAIERRARRAGIEVRYVDPKWTTALGKLKYRRRFRLSGHHAAALVIGRRGLGYGERLPEDSPPALKHTVVECFSTSGASRTLVQRLPQHGWSGGRRRRGRRTRARTAPAAGACGL